MWCSGNDVNEEGTAVILYEAMTSHPNTDTIARRNHVQCRPTASYAGGRPSYYNDDLHVQTIVIEPLRQSNPKCRICEDELFLLVQIYAPLDSWNGSGDTGEREGGVALDRTIYVFGCNR